METIKTKAHGAISVFATSRGANTNKFNRSAKLLKMFDALDSKLDGIIQRGRATLSEQFRCAVAVKMLMHTGIRTGNENSAEGYHSKIKRSVVKTYGVTTVLGIHATGSGKFIDLNFLGKRQVEQSYRVTNPKIVAPLRLLMQTVEENEVLFGISHYQLTKFVKKSVGKQFMPKDFRTLYANINAWKAYEVIAKRPLPINKREFNSEIREVTEYVAEILGNTPSITKKSYIDDMLWSFMTTVRWD